MNGSRINLPYSLILFSVVLLLFKRFYFHFIILFLLFFWLFLLMKIHLGLLVNLSWILCSVWDITLNYEYCLSTDWNYDLMLLMILIGQILYLLFMLFSQNIDFFQLKDFFHFGYIIYYFFNYSSSKYILLNFNIYYSNAYSSHTNYSKYFLIFQDNLLIIILIFDNLVPFQTLI